MTRKHALLTMLAAGHLVLVLAGATNFDLIPQGEHGEQALRFYGVLSGSDNGYWFFAPGVAQQMRVNFTLKDKNGRTWTHEPNLGENREEFLRMSTILGSFRNRNLSTHVAGSWALKIFADVPEAEEIFILVQMYELPTMADYREGKRGEWTNVHEFTLQRIHEGQE